MYIEQPMEFKEDIYHIASRLLTDNGVSVILNVMRFVPPVKKKK
jgi:hypothetical protein